MNEPRSQNELYVVKRITTDGSRPYNLSYNPGDDLQSWIEDMASYVKSIDPIHLLSTGCYTTPLCSCPLVCVLCDTPNGCIHACVHHGAFYNMYL